MNLIDLKKYEKLYKGRCFWFQNDVRVLLAKEDPLKVIKENYDWDYHATKCQGEIIYDEQKKIFSCTQNDFMAYGLLGYIREMEKFRFERTKPISMAKAFEIYLGFDSSNIDPAEKEKLWNYLDLYHQKTLIHRIIKTAHQYLYEHQDKQECLKANAFLTEILKINPSFLEENYVGYLPSEDFLDNKGEKKMANFYRFSPNAQKDIALDKFGLETESNENGNLWFDNLFASFIFPTKNAKNEFVGFKTLPFAFGLNQREKAKLRIWNENTKSFYLDIKAENESQAKLDSNIEQQLKTFFNQNQQKKAAQKPQEVMRKFLNLIKVKIIKAVKTIKTCFKTTNSKQISKRKPTNKKGLQQKEKDNNCSEKTTEIEKLLELNYESVCEFLIKKYGSVPGDYFLDLECSIKNKEITRGKDGLYIHHIDEDKAICLSNPEQARKNPFEYQKSNRLVYCNLLEHLILHIKIFEYPNDKKNPNEIVGVGGIGFIIPELNDIYSGIKYEQPWKQKVIENVLPYKNDYFKCIKRLVDKNFSYPLLTSFNGSKLSLYERVKDYDLKRKSTKPANKDIWSIENNKNLFEELKKMGVKH